MNRIQRSCVVVFADAHRRELAAAVCRRAAAEGLRVYVASAGDLPGLEAALAEAASGGGGVFVTADPAQAGAVDRLFARIVHDGFRADLVLYTAGTAAAGALLETTPEQLETQWRAVCLGGFLAGQAAIRHMLPHRHGTILYAGARDLAQDCAPFRASDPAKSGLRSLSQTMARAFGPQGIHVAHLVADLALDGGAGASVAEVAAEACWQVHLQQRTAWTQELDLTGRE